MSTPTIGITILIVLHIMMMAQLFIHRVEQRKRHKELKQRLDRLMTHVRG